MQVSYASRGAEQRGHAPEQRGMHWSSRAAGACARGSSTANTHELAPALVSVPLSAYSYAGLPR
jgi:hypothetical protein